MPYTFESEPHGVYKRFSGHVSAPEFLASVMHLQGLYDFDRVRYTINDFTDVASYDISEDDVVGFAARGIGANAFHSGVKVAIVTRDASIVALIDQYRTMAPFDLRVFDDLVEARTWAQAGLTD